MGNLVGVRFRTRGAAGAALHLFRGIGNRDACSGSWRGPRFRDCGVLLSEPELPDYAVGAIYGLAGALRAVLWSDEKPYVVSAGAPLPGGLEVDRIDLDDGVLVRTGGLGAEVLPWR